MELGLQLPQNLTEHYRVLDKCPFLQLFCDRENGRFKAIDWYDELVKLKETHWQTASEVFKAAEVWIPIAFRGVSGPERERVPTQSCNRASDWSDRDRWTVFVEFSWYLWCSPEHHGEALRYLNEERSKRGLCPIPIAINMPQTQNYFKTGAASSTGSQARANQRHRTPPGIPWTHRRHRPPIVPKEPYNSRVHCSCSRTMQTGTRRVSSAQPPLDAVSQRHHTVHRSPMDAKDHLRPPPKDSGARFVFSESTQPPLGAVAHRSSHVRQSLTNATDYGPPLPPMSTGPQNVSYPQPPSGALLHRSSNVRQSLTNATDHVGPLLPPPPMSTGPQNVSYPQPPLGAVAHRSSNVRQSLTNATDYGPPLPPMSTGPQNVSYPQPPSGALLHRSSNVRQSLTNATDYVRSPLPPMSTGPKIISYTQTPSGVVPERLPTHHKLPTNMTDYSRPMDTGAHLVSSAQLPFNTPAVITTEISGNAFSSQQAETPQTHRLPTKPIYPREHATVVPFCPPRIRSSNEQTPSQESSRTMFGKQIQDEYHLKQLGRITRYPSQTIAPAHGPLIPNYAVCGPASTPPSSACEAQPLESSNFRKRSYLYGPGEDVPVMDTTSQQRIPHAKRSRLLYDSPTTTRNDILVECPTPHLRQDSYPRSLMSQAASQEIKVDALYTPHSKVPAETEDRETKRLVIRLPRRVYADTSQSLISQKSQVPQASSRQLPKLPIRRVPPAWSESRQELCETLEWFRSYHGGVYFTGGYAKGYLLSAFASSRDMFQHDGKLIISHGGGKAECSQVTDGEEKVKEAGDQSAQDKSVNALLATYKACRPIVLIIDDKYALFPYDLASEGIAYAVLGFFIIAHAWAEYQCTNGSENRVIRYKFAFRWCESQGEPWWLDSSQVLHPSTPCSAENTPLASPITPQIPILGSNTLQPLSGGDVPQENQTLPERVSPTKVTDLSTSQRRPLKSAQIYVECGLCKVQTPHVYTQGWVCLNPKCSAFWTTADGSTLPDELEYTNGFLELLPATGIDDACPDLCSKFPSEVPSEDESSRFRRFCKGWHCGLCGRLSCRYRWDRLECANCGESYIIPTKIFLPKALNRRPKLSYYQHSIATHSGILHSEARRYDYGSGFGEYQTYTLPFGRGRIHHIRGKNAANQEADEIFIQYQDHAADGHISFQRWPLRTHKTRGRMLANYFSQNSGQPYQYVGEAAHTVPLDCTSSAVLRALDLIRNRIRQALGIQADFNEVLTAAYLQRQSMAFHSDDEKGLGPMVAGLSLGSPALMHFRLKMKKGEKKKGEKKKEEKKKGEKKNRPSADITFLLCHGDVLVMDGAGVQHFYEHTVIPSDVRIAATARRIDP